MRRVLGACLPALVAAMPAEAYADEIRERQLEQDVRELRRELQAQSRRIDQLERDLAQSAQRPFTTWAEKNPPPAPEASPWLMAENWDEVRPGMSADEVTKILGPPSSERSAEAGVTLLLYAVEIQDGVFLAGRVELQAGKVSAVQKPALR